MRIIWNLTVASFKMYFRQREALIWSFLLPLFLIILFSFVRFNGMGTIDVGIILGAKDRPAWLDNLRKIESLKIAEGTRAAELAALEKGDRDIVLELPASVADSGSAGQGSIPVNAFLNDGRPQQANIGMLVIQRVLDEAAFARSPMPGRIILVPKSVQSRNLTYLDFLIPGVIAMSIMQLGVFGVAFGFVSLKKRGILRRLSVTPIRPGDFITAQVAMRVVVTMLQIGLMVGVGIVFLHLHFIGSIFLMGLLGLLGATVFLGFGFAIAGVSKSEDQVAPMANIISLPMMLLSGVFFSRNDLPVIVRRITDFIPLTPLADAMRSVAVDGAGVGQLLPQILALVAWGTVSCFVAVKLFRWE